MKRSYGCAVELALEVLGGKRRAVILAHVKEGARHNTDIRHLIPRMSEKMLTQAARARRRRADHASGRRVRPDAAR